MHARVTRYEGGAPEEIDANLQRKKHVLPTEPGQTEGMKGVIFLTDRGDGMITVISLWEDEERDAGKRGRGDASSRGGHRAR